MDIDHSSIFSLRQRLDVCRIIDLEAAQDVAHVFSDSKTSETTWTFDDGRKKYFEAHTSATAISQHRRTSTKLEPVHGLKQGLMEHTTNDIAIAIVPNVDRQRPGGC